MKRTCLKKIDKQGNDQKAYEFHLALNRKNRDR
jgi:hypothetical protein